MAAKRQPAFNDLQPFSKEIKQLLENCKLRPRCPLTTEELVRTAGKTTGLPVLYNTSFNLFGGPLVCTPRDAGRSFYSSGIDTLFVGPFVLEK